MYSLLWLIAKVIKVNTVKIFFGFWKNERKSLDNVDIRDKASTTIVSFEWK